MPRLLLPGVSGPSTRLAVLVTALCATAACQVVRTLPPEPFRATTITSPPAANLSEACVDRFDPTLDYFPDKAEVEHAEQFEISYHDHYKVIDFTPSVYTQEQFRYILVQCGTPVPPHDPDDRVVQVPVARFISTSPAYGSVTDQLGVVDRLVGVDTHRVYTTRAIRERVEAGLVKEVGSGEHSSIEAAVAVHPDILLTFYSAYPQHNMHPKLWELGVVAVPVADHFEPHPLGRSEWIKLFAAFFNKERMANALFAPAARRYQALAARTAEVRDRPRMMLGFFDTTDAWHLMGGRNYMAGLIHDAGGEYFWRDEQTASLISVPFERVFLEAASATSWFAGFGVARTRSIAQLVDGHPRLQHLPPVERRAVYGSDRDFDDARGASPFTDQSLDKPDVVLADFVNALHPELLPEHELVFLRRLE